MAGSIDLAGFGVIPESDDSAPVALQLVGTSAVGEKLDSVGTFFGGAVLTADLFVVEE